MADTRIVQLATDIIKNTTKVDAYLNVKGLPTPSFHEDGPVDFGIESEDISRAREKAIDASLELHNLLLGPSLTLNATSLQAIYKYDIASKVPIHGEISFADLSAKCGLDLINLRRCLRFAMAHHYVFCEPRPEHVAHSAASRILLDSPTARAGVGWFFDELFHASARTLEARQKWGTDEPQHSGWSLSQNTDQSMWAHYTTHPEMAQRFAGCMSALAGMVGRLPSFLVNGYPWTSVGSSSSSEGQGLIVDVGGSKGTICIEIAKAAPHLHFIVQDLPETIRGAEGGVPADLKPRIEFMAHDMFTAQPVHDADVYLFRNVFHDWSDGHTVQALKALVPALKPGARVVVNDHFLPELGTMTPSKEREVRAMDMIMFALFNSRERAKRDWEAIFQQADPRFKDTRDLTPDGSALCIIECEWRDH